MSRSIFRTLVVTALCLVTAALVAAPAAQAAFGFKALDLKVTDSGGRPQLQAGTHPGDMTTTLAMNTVEVPPSELCEPAPGQRCETPDEAARDIEVGLPEGIVGDPTAVPPCPNEDFTQVERETFHTDCEDASAVGIAGVEANFGPLETGPGHLFYVPVYNLRPLPGEAARLGFIVLNEPVTIDVGVSQSAPYRVVARITKIPQPVQFFAAELQIWGNPASPEHDTQRGHCIKSNDFSGSPVSEGSCPPSGITAEEPFLTLPRACDGPLRTSFSADSWELPGTFVTEDAPSTLAFGGCEALEFGPTIAARPTATSAESPTGLDFDLDVDDPRLIEPDGTADSDIEKVVVTLPEGVTTNPSVANGLAACTLAQYRAITIEPGSGCPGASKVGSVEVETPLLKGTILNGSIYVAKQGDNTFDNLLTIYMVLRDSNLGILIKLPGRVDPNPSTGQLTTTFAELPQVPFSHLHLHFKEGARAPLITPGTCGTYTARALLYPYSHPAAPRIDTASFEVNAGANGTGCVASPSQLPHAPKFSAGTLSPSAGTYSPFVMKLSRDDGSQQFSRISTTLPEGLIGKLAGIPYCPEAGIAQASARSGEGEGALEAAGPSCPQASEVGTVLASAGSGPEPLYVTGHVYLAGPYNGAPLSLEIISPAIAGPFDLGVVAVRVALQVDPFSVLITATSDPIPTILHGLPLDLRSIAVDMSRPGFTVNPTSCEPKAIIGSATSTFGAVAPLSQYFQVSGCGALKYKPKLRLRLTGATKRTGHPALRAVVTAPARGAYANTARIQVGLPHSEFLDQGNLDKVCTQPELKSATCPKGSVYGHVKVWTPLFEKPLQGNVYIGVGFGHKLPDLVTELNGQVRVLLHGRVDTTRRKGLRNTFEFVPDAPYSRVVLQLKGGKKYGLLENSENICRKAQRASARFVAQNGRAVQLRPRIANDCRKGKRGGRSHRSHHPRH